MAIITIKTKRIVNKDPLKNVNLITKIQTLVKNVKIDFIWQEDNVKIMTISNTVMFTKTLKKTLVKNAMIELYNLQDKILAYLLYLLSFVILIFPLVNVWYVWMDMRSLLIRNAKKFPNFNFVFKNLIISA